MGVREKVVNLKYNKSKEESMKEPDTMFFERFNINTEAEGDKMLEFIKLIHKKSGHVGRTKTYLNIYKSYKIEKVKSKVAKMCRSCKKCNLYKIKTETKKSKVKIYSKKIFDKVSTNVYGPFRINNIKQEGDFKKGYFLTITDIYSIITELYFAHRMTGTKVVSCFKKWIKKYKPLNTIVSDNGTGFKNRFVEKWLSKQKIKHVFIPAYVPYANGISETLNKTISEIIKIYQTQN